MPSRHARPILTAAILLVAVLLETTGHAASFAERRAAEQKAKDAAFTAAKARLDQRQSVNLDEDVRLVAERLEYAVAPGANRVTPELAVPYYRLGVELGSAFATNRMELATFGLRPLPGVTPDIPAGIRTLEAREREAVELLGNVSIREAIWSLKSQLTYPGKSYDERFKLSLQAGDPDAHWIAAGKTASHEGAKRHQHLSTAAKAGHPLALAALLNKVPELHAGYRAYVEGVRRADEAIVAAYGPKAYRQLLAPHAEILATLQSGGGAQLLANEAVTKHQNLRSSAPHFDRLRHSAGPLKAALAAGFRPDEDYTRLFLAKTSVGNPWDNLERQHYYAIVRDANLAQRDLAAFIQHWSQRLKADPQADKKYTMDGELKTCVEVFASWVPTPACDLALQDLLGGGLDRHAEPLIAALRSAGDETAIAAWTARLGAQSEARVAALEAAAEGGDLNATLRLADARLFGDPTIPVAAAPEKAAPWLQRLSTHPQVDSAQQRRARGNLALLQWRGLGLPADRAAAVASLLSLDGLVTVQATAVATLVAADATTTEVAPPGQAGDAAFRPWTVDDANGMSAASLKVFTDAQAALAAAPATPRTARAAAVIAVLIRAESAKLREQRDSIRRNAAAYSNFVPTPQEQQFLNDYRNIDPLRRLAQDPVPTKKAKTVRGEVYKYDGIYFKHTVTGDKTVLVDMTPQEKAEAAAEKKRAGEIVAQADATHTKLQADLAKRRAAHDARIQGGRDDHARANALDQDYIIPLDALVQSLEVLAGSAARS